MAIKCLITDIETTLSVPKSFIPRTPVDFRPLKTLTAVVENLIALPESVKSITSSSSPAIRALTNSIPSLSSIAIFPLERTFVKSERAFRLTSPAEVAKIICRLSHSFSSTSTGIIAAIETPTGIGNILTIAFPLAVLPPKGNRQVLSL